MRKSILLPGLALASGAVGLLLRRWELATAFEPDGLPLPGAPATTALALLTVAYLVVSALLTWRMCQGAAPLTFDEAYHCPSQSYITANVCCAALLVLAGGLGVWDYVNHRVTNPFFLLLDALLVLSAGCVLLTGRNNYRDTGNGRFSAPLLVPAYTGCLWLILTYQTRAGDPILQDYVYLILAVIATLLGLYQMARFSYEKGKPFAALWTGFAAVYFSAVTLTDGHELMYLPIQIFSMVYFTTHGAVLLRALGTKREETPHE